MIHHVNVAVDDIASATEFYRDIIGLDPIATPDLGFPAQFFSIAPGQELHVNQLDDLHQQRAHFCLRLDDFAAWSSAPSGHDGDRQRGLGPRNANRHRCRSSLRA